MPLALVPWLLGGAVVGGVGYSAYTTSQKLFYALAIIAALYYAFKVVK